MSVTIEIKDSPIQRKVINQVTKRLEYLTAGGIYTLAAILGEEFWEEDDDDSHNALGRAFAGLVVNNRLLFEPNGWTSNRHNEYRYTPTS